MSQNELDNESTHNIWVLMYFIAEVEQDLFLIPLLLIVSIVSFHRFDSNILFPPIVDSFP